MQEKLLGPDSIRKARQFGAKRIGHGIRCIEDEELIKELIEKKITLEVCPTSNLQTNAIKGEYPLEKLYKRGVKITINTDNNTVSNTNIIDEYKWVLDNTDLQLDDLINMNINSANSAFILPQYKERLIAKISKYKNKA